MQRFTRTTLLTAISLAVIAALYFGISYLGNSQQQPASQGPPFKLPHDSPIEVAGGSIHVCSPSLTITEDGKDRWTIPLTLDDADVFNFNHVTNKPTPPSSSEKGWEMDISNKSKSGEEPNAVVLKWDGTNISINIPGGKGVLTNNMLSFQDTAGCSGKPEDHSCVHLEHIAFDGSKAGTCESSPGKEDGYCDIYIGRPLDHGTEPPDGQFCRSTLPQQ